MKSDSRIVIQKSQTLHSTSPEDETFNTVEPFPISSYTYASMQINAIKQEIKSISEQIPHLEYLQKRALLAVNWEQASSLGTEIDRLANDLNAKTASVRTKIAKLSEGTAGSNTAKRLALTQQRKQGKAFMEVTRRLEDVQATHKSALKQQLHRQYMIVNPEATEADLASLGDPQQMMFSLANKSIAQKTLIEMRERQVEVKNIEKSMQDLHQIFLQVQLLVGQQGEVLDRLEAQIGDTEQATESAVGEMRGAVEKKKSAQKKKWILLLLIIVILGIVGIVLGVSLGNK